MNKHNERIKVYPTNLIPWYYPSKFKYSFLGLWYTLKVEVRWLNKSKLEPMIWAILYCSWRQRIEMVGINSPPRATLTKTALGFILLNASSLNISRVSSVSGHATITKSLCLKSWSNETNSAPYSLAEKKVIWISGLLNKFSIYEVKLRMYKSYMDMSYG